MDRPGKKRDMKLSVIIPGYNTPDAWWDRCLKSVIAALPDESEIVCVDDGSKVRPQPTVDAPSIRWICLEKNVGQSAARNIALKSAVGEYVTFVDSDDEVCGDVYRHCLDNLNRDEADVAVFGARTIWTGLGLYKDDAVCEAPSGPLTDAVAESLYRGCLLEYTWNKVYRRSFLAKNAIRLPEGLCPGEDTIFNLQVIRAKAVWTFVNVIGYVYYRYDGSSLSRYLPTNLLATRTRADLWKSVFSFAHNECTEEENLKSEWENIWRHDSPISYLERYRFARSYGYCFVDMLVKTFVRRFLYGKLVRRWRMRRMYPYAQAWRDDKR